MYKETNHLINLILSDDNVMAALHAEMQKTLIKVLIENNDLIRDLIFSILEEKLKDTEEAELFKLLHNVRAIKESSENVVLKFLKKNFSFKKY